MELHNKNRIAYLSAITLLLSYAEMLLPKFVPFFRLGLGNIAILLALNLPFPELILLSIIKSIAASMMNGTLLSPFFIISISQSILSAVFMWAFFKIKKNWLSIYGISLIGSATSAFVQIELSALYLGKSTFALLGPMLIFSIISAAITAFLSQILHIPEKAPLITIAEKPKNSIFNLIFVILIFITVLFCFMINNVYILVPVLICSFILQIISKRKIFILPHITMWIFVILVNLFSPNGKILFKIGSFGITLNSLLLGIEKSLKLSIAAALSQCAASLKAPETTLIGMSLAYFRGLSDNFRNQKGNIIVRLQNTLKTNTL